MPGTTEGPDSVTTTMTPTLPSTAKPRRRIPGEEGTWIFILGDMCVFAVFFCCYMVSRSDNPDLFASSQETLNRNFGALNTVVLLVSSLMIVLAVKAMRVDRREIAQRLIVGAFACGLVFIVVKLFEYHEHIAAGHTPSTNDFYTLYFVLTGLHLFHLLIGLGVLTSLWSLARKAELSNN